jgi:hypothetical protein
MAETLTITEPVNLALDNIISPLMHCNHPASLVLQGRKYFIFFFVRYYLDFSKASRMPEPRALFGPPVTRLDPQVGIGVVVYFGGR